MTIESELQVELLLPQSVLAGAAQACPPALQRLLRHARSQAGLVGDESAWCCSLFGVAQQQDWPLAPFACAADGLEADQAYWLCAAPVHLLLMRDSFSVTDAAADSLDLAQAQQLTQALNAHFAADGLRFFAPQSDRWYLRLAHPPALRTTSLAEALGRDVQKSLPQGADALQWNARLNEMQMLLHGHALNHEREQCGLLPVNSVWLWGGGVRRAAAPQPLQAWAHDAGLRGLALAHGGSAARLPDSAAAWLPQVQGGRHVLMLERARQEESHAALQRLEADWLAPLLQALRDGGVHSLTLHLAHAGQVRAFHLRRGDLRKFWRRARPLGDYLG